MPLGAARQQRRWRSAGEIGLHRVEQERKDLPPCWAQVATGVQMRSHHRRPFSLRVRWRMCRSITTKPVACSARWFVGSMGRWGEEAEGRFPVLARPFGQVPGVLGVRHAGGGCLQYLFPGRFQRLLKVPRRHRATLDRLEQVVRQSFWRSSAAGALVIWRRWIVWSSVSSSVATRCPRCSQFRQGVASRTFLGREDTHSPRRDQDPSAAR
jgi:hypothetical protein